MKHQNIKNIKQINKKLVIAIKIILLLFFLAVKSVLYFIFALFYSTILEDMELKATAGKYISDLLKRGNIFYIFLIFFVYTTITIIDKALVFLLFFKYILKLEIQIKRLFHYCVVSTISFLLSLLIWLTFLANGKLWLFISSFIPFLIIVNIFIEYIFYSKIFKTNSKKYFILFLIFSGIIFIFSVVPFLLGMLYPK